MKLQFILINIFCIWVGCLFTFTIWFFKFSLEKLSLMRTVEEGHALSEKIDTFENHIKELKSEIDIIKDPYNLSETLNYIICITPVIKRYKEDLEKKMKKMTYKLEKKGDTLENTLKTMNMFLGIISFGKLEIRSFKDYNKDEF